MQVLLSNIILNGYRKEQTHKAVHLQIVRAVVSGMVKQCGAMFKVVVEFFYHCTAFRGVIYFFFLKNLESSVLSRIEIKKNK